MSKSWDVLGLGNAIMDVLAPVDDQFLSKHNMHKGAMALIAQEDAERIYQALQNPQQVAGGAVANSCVGIAMLGGNPAYIGKVKNDALGNAFASDIQKSGVHYAVKKSQAGPSTARSMIVVTPDGQRTMNTFLGAALYLEKDDIDAHLVAHSKVTFIEGYLWDTPHLRPHLQLAAGLCHAAGQKLAFTLSDAWLIDRHRDDMRRFVRDHVDILFANELEIVSFYQTSDMDAAIKMLANDCDLAVVTRSEQGSVICQNGQTIAIPAAPTKVVDTTGAGDLYAGGFLFGLTNDYPLERCGRIAAICAAEIISHIGARAQVNLAELVQQKIALV